ncbi:TPA: D-2-hydroxyacid dehydrogenase [Vibrio vulnificus]|uniref:D-2-hydroxyacid dehydrogenase n=1 Tax=Vibrio vulnificus TaxID=672 RepID=UPI001A2D32D7|nr:D-2-hydroxyacid dehydrogenase [Vibrio vulnificus]MCA0762741.1 D-2-hydroxyacid dehydrogenase [Vibrio vulnificus]HAS6253168.1 glycerate dehydrogenase [Vibrio vulnificus]HDY7676207.1 D-2-hydroxyacid dehydrogenase [Vibrio vulnificus]HDY8201380.1 D-2-hydroxyacid dehydrogenase [Vibrio vulnificus]
MSLPVVVFLDRATIPAHITLPTLAFEHRWVEYDFTSPEQVIERLQEADIVITNKVLLDQAVLAQLPNLRMIAVAATGFNNVDVDFCAEKGIAVANVRGYATRSVPEHVIAMLFALRRNLFGYHQDIAAGVWQQDKQFCFFSHPIGDVAGSTLGIIGSGALGQATAQLAQALGMKVLFAERKGQNDCRQGYHPFEEVLAQADAISLHCPLSEQTHHLIGAAELACMKSNAILINTGRGGLVDEQALVEALKEGDIAAAGVDVFSAEPADESNPLLANMHLPNLLLTPHVAWGSDSAITQLCEILLENINAYWRGETLNRLV